MWAIIMERPIDRPTNRFELVFLFNATNAHHRVRETHLGIWGDKRVAMQKKRMNATRNIHITVKHFHIVTSHFTDKQIYIGAHRSHIENEPMHAYTLKGKTTLSRSFDVPLRSPKYFTFKLYNHLIVCVFMSIQ